MSQEFIDYNKVLADLEAKRDALNDAIEGIKKMLTVSGQAATNGNASFDAQDIPSNAFFGMNIGEAAVKYLTIAKRKMSGRDIADALERGGYQHTSKNFNNTVNTTLARLASGDNPVLVKVGREWGLREWYPGFRAKQGRSEQDNSARQGQTEETDSDIDARVKEIFKDDSDALPLPS